MAWFRVDDTFSDHPKVKRIPRSKRLAAVGLWTIAGTWAAKHRTDGRVPEYMIEEFGATASVAAALVAVGLWEAEADGWSFHNWTKRQPTREELTKRDADNARRQQEWRDRKASERSDQQEQDNVTRYAGVTPPVTQRVTPASRNGGVPLSRPDPSRPVPTRPVVTTEPPSPQASRTPSSEAFDRFWAAYPRKVGKDGARKVFGSACRRADPEEIIAGALRLRDDPNLPDAGFIPHPSTWLNAGRWSDDPYPAPAADRRTTLSTTDARVGATLDLARRYAAEEALEQRQELAR